MRLKNDQRFVEIRASNRFLPTSLPLLNGPHRYPCLKAHEVNVCVTGFLTLCSWISMLLIRLGVNLGLGSNVLHVSILNSTLDTTCTCTVLIHCLDTAGTTCPSNLRKQKD
jgi:hypothetical protein